MSSESESMSAPVHAVVSRLRELGKGTKRWEVRSKTEDSICIWFDDFEQDRAKHWWDTHQGHHNAWELVLVPYRCESERVMMQAADLIEHLSG